MISRIIARVRSLWRGARRRSDVEAEMNEEFRLHVELRAQDLMRSGLTSAEALRRARREFGSAERHKEEARAARGLHYFDGLRFSWLDFKLGFRMLARYPGLTVVGGLAMAFAVWIGAGTFELIGQWLYPRLPLPDGDRIVGIQLRDMTSRDQESRLLHDFVTWREELESVEDVSAFRTVERNLFVSEVAASRSRWRRSVRLPSGWRACNPSWGAFSWDRTSLQAHHPSSSSAMLSGRRASTATLRSSAGPFGSVTFGPAS